MQGNPRLFPKVAIGVVATLISLGCAHTSCQEARFEASVGKPGDTIERVEAGKTTIWVATSPSGIGTATLTRLQGGWPADLRIRLRYAEGRPFGKIEGFTCSADRSPPMSVEEIACFKDYAEVRLPEEVLRSHPHTLRVQWVDYYRH